MSITRSKMLAGVYDSTDMMIVCFPWKCRRTVYTVFITCVFIFAGLSKRKNDFKGYRKQIL